MLQTEDWITQWCLQNALFKERPEKNILNLAAAGISWLMLLLLSEGTFGNYFLWRGLLQNKHLNVSVFSRVRGVCQKMHLGNCIKRWSVRRVDCITDWNSCFSGRRHFCFTKLVETKFSFRIPLYHRRNCWYRSLGRRETLSGSWLLQIVDTAEGMINVAFIERFNHRKAASALRNRYAEHFCSKMWQHGSGKLFA